MVIKLLIAFGAIAIGAVGTVLMAYRKLDQALARMSLPGAPSPTR